jgi:hypothetical protein
VLSYVTLRPRLRSGELLAVPGPAGELAALEREIIPAEGR